MVSSLKKSGKWEENCVEPSMKYPSLRWSVSWCYVMDLLSPFAELPHFEPLRLRVLSRRSEDHMLKYILSSSFNCLFTLLERPSEGLSLPPVGSCSSCCCCCFFITYSRVFILGKKKGVPRFLFSLQVLPLVFSAPLSNYNTSQFSGKRLKILSLSTDDDALSFFSFIHHSVFWLSGRLLWDFSLCFPVFILFVSTPSSPISRFFIFPSSQTWLGFRLLFWSYSWNTLFAWSVIWFRPVVTTLYPWPPRSALLLTHSPHKPFHLWSITTVYSDLSQPELCLMTLMVTVLNLLLRPVT